MKATGEVVGSIIVQGKTYLLIEQDVSAAPAAPSPEPKPISNDARRARLLENASRDIGNSFMALGKAGGAIWQELGLTAMAGKAWCGAWVLKKLREEKLTTATWKIGLGFVAGLKLPITKTPKPADIAYKDQPNQHYAFVKTFKPFVTLDGNSTGGVVKENEHASTAGWTFYSIDKLLR